VDTYWCFGWTCCIIFRDGGNRFPIYQTAWHHTLYCCNLTALRTPNLCSVNKFSLKKNKEWNLFSGHKHEHMLCNYHSNQLIHWIKYICKLLPKTATCFSTEVPSSAGHSLQSLVILLPLQKWLQL
jgi:hypothetical protein